MRCPLIFSLLFSSLSYPVSYFFKVFGLTKLISPPAPPTVWKMCCHGHCSLPVSSVIFALFVHFSASVVIVSRSEAGAVTWQVNLTGRNSFLSWMRISLWTGFWGMLRYNLWNTVFESREGSFGVEGQAITPCCFPEGFEITLSPTCASTSWA